jgi:DNA polymerase-3 subunit gamma/tau
VEITHGSSLNVHELDAASNNGVDAMRDLVAHAGLGTPGRWKVYIVDEVHMLSTAAANALLKTLEEPPSHVVFVLATTDPQKVPPTIRSRTQHLEFRLLGAETLHGLLESVNAEAGLGLEEEALEAAVRRGRGSARDALSALDQVVASGSSDAARPELAAVVDALAEGDVQQVLVALAALIAGGWGPQQLATELIDDLRQIFLAALAPELCAVSGTSLERYAGLAETMGLPRAVRSMEILGHALVDMREAPDAQVVLEIAMVRAVRPDLDSGAEALSERVSVLERSISGVAAFPRPGAEHSARTAPAATPPAAPETPPVGEPAAPVGSRPSLGAVQRGKRAGATSAPASAAPEPVAVDPTSPESAVAEPGATPPAAAPEVKTPAAETPAATAAPGEAGGRRVDRDSLTEAWGDGILQSLPARAKARFASGRFVAVDEQGVHFALPNAAHRDQCAEQVPLVESALASHFGTTVKLVLVIDESAAPAARTGTAAAPPAPAAKSTPRRGRGRAQEDAPPTPPSEEYDEVDPAEFAGSEEGGPDQATEAETRLLEAFPGASEVLG